MKDKTKAQKNNKGTEKKKFSVWKAALITLGSVIALAGIIFLIIFLTGGFDNPPKNPENIYFADVVVQEDGSTSYVAHGSSPYDVEGNFKLVVSTSTEEFNQTGLELNFPSTQTKYYLMEVDLEDQVSEASRVFYAFDEYGNRIKFASCGQAQATHITNGVVIVPRYVSINSQFDVLAVIAPDDLNSEITAETKLYNVGGYTQLIASSTTNVSISSTSAYINVDVPVEGFEVVGVTKNGSNEQELSEAYGYIEVSTESLFSVIAKVTPSRAIYKYGKDGTNGTREYKTVIFALDNDVNNSGQKINFVNTSNVPIEDSFMEYSNEISFNGQYTQGASFLTYALTGNVRIYARMFKTAEEEDLAMANSSSISQVYSAMESSELYVISNFMIKEIEIDGFEATDDYNNGNPLRVDINNPTIIYANNPDALANLGITINSSQGSAQNHIRNILISLQFMIGDTWYDATRINVVGDQTIPALFSLYSSNELVTGDDLGIDAGNSYYNFNFYRPIYLSTSNLSYWEVYGRPAAENISAYGISSIRIYVCYLSPDQGLMLDNQAYGPYEIETEFNDVVEPILSWNDGDLETSIELGVGEYNDRVFIGSGSQFAEYNSIEIESLANISNMASNPTYKTIRFFIYSSNPNLDQYLNVSRYNGTISGVSGEYIYEVSPSASSLVISSLEEDSIAFNLIFAVVEDDGSVPTINEDGTYRIISLPTNLNGQLISIPFRISKVIEDIEVGFSPVEEGQETSQVFPYGEGDQRFFILQNTQNNLWAEISVSNEEASLFMTAARNGAIVINLNENFYVLVGSRQVPLNEVLTTIFSNSDPETAYSSIFSIEQGATQTTFKIKLSTASLNFDENDEIQTNLSLTYTLSGDNLPPSYSEITSNSENFYIYSGKVQNAEFGDGETTETVIEVDKTVTQGENPQFGISFSRGELLLLNVGGNYYLKVNVEGFGINDTYSVISNDSSVVSLSWDAAMSMYRISFLSSGNATLTLSVNFPHSSFETKQISVVVSSNYTTNAEYGLPENNQELGIISYNPQIGYEILGREGYEISFYDLIKIFATSNNVQTDITTLFSFAAIYDNPDDFENRVTFVESDGSLTGIRIDRDFGAVANLTISASNPEIGVTYSFSIVIEPNHQLITSVTDQGASKPENAPVGSYGVYSESSIAFNNFGLFAYTFDTGAYTTALAKTLYFTLILNDGTEILATGDLDEGLVFSAGGATIATFDGTVLTFSAGISGVNTLRISDSQTPDSFDLVYEIVFCVSDNIELSTEGNSDVTTSQEEIDGEMVTVVNLNNYENSVLNDSAISVSSNGQITFGSTGIALNFVREYAALATYQGTFKLEIESSSADGDLTIGGATIETEVLLKITYGSEINGAFVGKSFYIRLYIAPNITLNSNATTVIYNGKQYVSLYTSQATSGIYNWFNRAGGEISGISFGEIAPSGSVLSLARLSPKVGTPNITVGNRSFTIERTEEGLITTKIVVYYTSADGTRENKVFNVLITPFNWNEYIQPGAEDDYKTEGGESFDRASSDLKEVLSGVYRQTIVGGEEIDLQSHILGSTLGTLIGSSTTRITYNLYRVEESGETLMNAGWAYVGYGSDGRIKLLTQPVAEDFNYRIEFTFISQAKGFEDATFVFNYYVTVSTGQKIEIAYPFTDGTQSYPYESGQTIDQVISSFSGNYSEMFADPTQTHMLYYDQFENGLYTIDLNSSLRNFNSNSPFVSVYNLKNGVWEQKLQTNAQNYNRISYSLYKVYSDGQEITANLSSFVSVSSDGKIEIKAQNSSLGIIIKATTPNLSENYYKIFVSPRGSETVSISQGGQSQVLEMGDVISISDGFNLGQFSGQGIGQDTLKFAIIDETGRIQTESDMIYITTTEHDENIIVVKTSPNQQSAILVIYTESLGTLVELDLVADSAIIVSYDTSKIIYGDSQVLISDLISITTDYGATYLDSKKLNALNYAVTSPDSTGTVTLGKALEKDELLFNISPISSVKNVELTLNIWGDNLPQSSEDNPCTLVLRLTIYPRFVPVTGGEQDIVANDGKTEIDISDIFDLGAFAQTKKYQVLNSSGKTVSAGSEGAGDYYINSSHSLVWNDSTNGVYYVVETSQESGEIVGFRKVSVSDGEESIYPVSSSRTSVRYLSSWTLTIDRKNSTPSAPASVRNGLFINEIVWAEGHAGAYVLTWSADTLGTGYDVEQTNLVIVSDDGSAVYYSFSGTASGISTSPWPEENSYKYSISYTWDGLGNEAVTISPTPGTLGFKAEGSAMSITNFFTVSTTNIASDRTIVITVRIWKEVGGEVVGETVSGTYVLKVKPKYIIEVGYPDYGTGATMESEAIYVGQTNPTIDLSKDTRVVLKEWVWSDKNSGKGEYQKIDYNHLLQFTTTSSYISIAGSTVTVNAVGKAISSNQTVRIDIELSVGKDKWIGVGSYNLILSPTPVLGATFPESTTEGGLTETIPDTEVKNGEKIFVLNDGYVKVTMNQNTVNRGVVYFELLANPKYSYFNEKAPSPVRIYLIGGSSASYAKMYVLSNDNDGGAKSAIATIENVESFDILGTDNDASIATLSGGSLTFQQAGLWPIAITTSSGTNYYYVQVNNSFAATYYSELKLEASGDAVGGLKFETIFGDISNKDMYEFSVSQESAVGTDAINQLTVVQPSSKVEFYYTNGDVTYKIPFETALSNYKIGEQVEVEEEPEGVTSIDVIGTDTDSDIAVITSGKIVFEKAGNWEIKVAAGEGIETYIVLVTEVQKGETISYSATYYLISDYVNYNVDYKEHRINIFNQFNTVVGTYIYQVELNYSFPEDSFNEVNNGSAEGSYEEGELIGFENGTLISETIELNAGQSYSLVSDLLIGELGLRTFDGGSFVLDSAAFTFSLTHGKYTTNSGFANNLDSLISISQNGKDYVISPHGAQNGGDIVHLKLEIKTDGTVHATYYLRIHINPEVILSLVDTSGEKTLNFSSDTNIMDLPLSSLVYVNSAIDPSKLQVIVVSGDSAGYVVGEGSNRLQNLKPDQTGLSAYGIRLNQTVLGGAQIRIIIVDEYGYQATDSSGNPAILTIHYRNSDGSSVSYNRGESSTQIFEGDTIEIWAKVDGGYKKWTNSWGDTVQEISAEGNVALIVLDNIPTNVISEISVSIAQSEELNSKLNGKTLLNGTALNYIPNTIFGSSERISGNNFVITVKAKGTVSETLSFTINPTIRQRYRLTFASLYDSETILYIPIVDCESINISGYFQLYDIKENREIEETDEVKFNAEFEEGGGISKPAEYTLNTQGFVVGGDGIFELSYEITSSDGSTLSSNQISVGYQLTQKFFGIDTSGANVVGNYGVVVEGGPSLNEIGIDSWGEGVTLLDYYGSPVEVSSSYSGYFSEKSVTPAAGATVVINVYGDEGQTNQIGTLRVTRARYYGLNIPENTNTIYGGNTLTFSGGDSDGWGKVIRAIVSGTKETTETEAETEPLVGGLSGFFTYQAEGATVVYDPSRGEYVINTTGSPFILTISYMGYELGQVSFTKSEDGDPWTISEPVALTVEALLSQGAAQDNNAKTITISSLSALQGKGLWALDLTYNSGWTIYLGNGTNSLNLIGYGTIISSGARVVINSNAFRNCSDLVRIWIEGNNLAQIGSRAFLDCTSLNSITLPNGLTSIGEYAFHNCGNLTAITIPTTITSIGEQALSYTGLASIVVPGSINAISNGLFSNCTNLSSVTLQEGVKTIGSFAFDGCVNLAELTINSTNLTSLGNSAFNNCSKLTSLNIGAGATVLPSNLFSGNNLIRLTKIIVEAGSNLSSALPAYALWDKNRQEVANFSGAGTYVKTADASFLTVEENDESLGSVEGEGKHAIGMQVALTATANEGAQFLGWATSLDPNTMEILSTQPTYTFTLSLGSPLTYYALFNSTTTTSQTVGSLEYTFYNEAKLARVTDTTSTSLSGTLEIPSVVSSGGNSYKVYSIGSSAFYDCSYLNLITIPEGIVEIGNYAFYDCSALTLITLPSTLTTIGSNAFSGCTGLSSITIPEKVTSIGSSAFRYCKLSEFRGQGNSYYTIDDNRALIVDGGATLLAYAVANLKTSYLIPEGVTEIGAYTFYNHRSLTSITIPEGVTSIGTWAFFDCSNLTSINLPSTLTEINSSAFSGCYALAIVYNNSGLNITEGAISYERVAYYAKEVVANGQQAQGRIEEIGDVNYYFNEKTGEFIALAPSISRDSITQISIVDEAKEINLYAFEDCVNLTSITLPSTLTSIGNSAFYNCSGLTSITIPEGVKEINSSAFSGCYALAIVYNNSSLEITKGESEHGWVAYYAKEVVANGQQAQGRIEESGNVNYYINETTGEYIALAPSISRDSVTQISIVNGAKEINRYAFEDCVNLTSITLPSTLTKIGDYAFYNCSALSSITLPSTITTVGSYAFRLCTNLEEITINGDIETIGAGASSDCKNVKKLTLGADVTSIPSNLFSTGLLTNLTEIVVLGDLNSTTFPSGTWTKGGTTVTQFSGAGTYLKSEE